MPKNVDSKKKKVYAKKKVNEFYKKDGVVKDKQGKIIEKTQSLTKADKTPFTLKEIKELSKKFDNHIKKGNYIILGLNYTGVSTIKQWNGSFYDEVDEYYDTHGYDKNEYEKFYQIQVIHTL